MGIENQKGKRFGKIGIARANSIESGDVTTTDARVSPMAQSLGITFDGNNNVATNQTEDRLDALELIDSGTRLDLIEAKINSLATLFGITFDGSGAITIEGYSGHTHDYLDGTINDTGDGTGTQTDTTRSTDVVN